MDTDHEHENSIAKKGHLYDNTADGRITKIKLLKTVLLVIPFMTMGMSHSVQYTTIPDMRVRLQTEAQYIAFAMTMGNLGNVIGGPLALFADRFARYADLLIAMNLYVVAVSYGGFPFSAYLWQLGALDFTFSFGWSMYQASAHSVVSHIWGAEGGFARFAMHFGYPLGSVLGPLIAMPFVGQKSNIDVQNLKTTNVSYNTNISSSDMTTLTFITEEVDPPEFQEDTSSIEYAYLIVSAVIFVAGTLFLLSYACCIQNTKTTATNKKKKSFRQVLSSKEWAEGDTKFGVMIVVFMMGFLLLQLATMKGSQEYLVTYAVDSGMFTTAQAALLNSLTYGAGTIGRGLAVIVVKFVPIPYMLFVETHGQFIFGVLCLIFGTQSKTALWILAPCLGFFRELMWPSGYTWTDYYVVLLGVIAGLLDTACQIANMGFISLQGYLYDNTVIDSIFYTTVAYGFVQLVLMYVMTYCASRKGGRKARALKALENEEITLSLHNTKL